jgi:hypothetical protein
VDLAMMNERWRQRARVVFQIWAVAAVLGTLISAGRRGCTAVPERPAQTVPGGR